MGPIVGVGAVPKRHTGCPYMESKLGPPACDL